FIMEGISSDIQQLKLLYRYTPQWRFKFENKHATYKKILADNRVERKQYESIGPSYHLEGVNLRTTIEEVSKHKAAIEDVYKQLLAIESIFPPSIINSTDEAYLNYKKLKSEIEEEINFQYAYLKTLSFFEKEMNSRGNPLELVKTTDAFIDFFKEKDKFSKAVVKEAATVLENRLIEIPPFYNQRLKGKNDSKPLEEETFYVNELLKIKELCELASITPKPEYLTLANFVKAFNEKSMALIAVSDSLKNIYMSIEAEKKMPSDDFFRGIVKRAETIKEKIPSLLGEEAGEYLNYRCSEILNNEITQFKNKFETELANFKEAEALVPSLNALKAQKSYREMLGILKQKLHLTFLIPKYKELDKMSVEEQGQRIYNSLLEKNWAGAEKGLRELHEDVNFLNPAEILPIKNSVVEEYEDSLYIFVDRYSRARISRFVEENYTNIDNVDSLYNDSVFLPAYDITFSSGSKKELIQRKNDLIEHLAKMKDNEFPAKAITLLYKDFISKPEDNGVMKARAIVTHGKYYKGDDKQIKIRIAECDPTAVKWITKAKEYRRIFALPISNLKKGKNTYIVRINVDIAGEEANFPVYDVNIKVPEEIAKNAGTEQWYDKITLNKKELKNEGRFTISAPTAANGYECQITPVQMTKGKNNILEIVFSHPSFKAHPISIMVQKPIIKKN
ncbi:MAG: hypothetical protein N2053_05465, partial [Chitinispirillaceae bacterium]|nr:hypothetical protein [Chitinispirillaceae bacterium]